MSNEAHYCPNCHSPTSWDPTRNLAYCAKCQWFVDKTALVPAGKQEATAGLRYLERTFGRSILLAIILIGGSLAAGLATQISQEEAEELERQFTEQFANVTALDIFLNNWMLTMPTILPFVGIPWHIFVQFSTGFAINALGMAMDPPVPGWLAMLALIIVVPHIFFLEYAAYTFALGESIGLSYLTVRRKGALNRIRRQSWKTIIVATGLLAIGAVVELAFIGAP